MFNFSYVKEMSSHSPRSAAESANQSYVMSSVRLCFQVYVRTVPHGPRYALRPVVTHPVRDKRENLVIHKLSHAAGSARGGQQIILLCERVKKEEIQVEFRQLEAGTGITIWSAFGRFEEADVHRQVAITFLTPAYRDPDTTESQVCYIRLVNRRTHDCSVDRRYEYHPAPSEGASVRRGSGSDMFLIFVSFRFVPFSGHTTAAQAGETDAGLSGK